MLAKVPQECINLLEAADIVEKRGLAKGTREDETTFAVCIHGAISLVTSGNAWRSSGHLQSETMLVAQYLMSRGVSTDHNHRVFVLPTGGLACWNNAAERTQAEVVEALRGAALHKLT